MPGDAGFAFFIMQTVAAKVSKGTSGYCMRLNVFPFLQLAITGYKRRIIDVLVLINRKQQTVLPKVC